MIALIQRVTRAKVEVEQQLIGQINQGLLVLLGGGKRRRSGESTPLMRQVIGLSGI